MDYLFEIAWRIIVLFVLLIIITIVLSVMFVIGKQIVLYLDPIVTEWIDPPTRYSDHLFQ